MMFVTLRRDACVRSHHSPQSHNPTRKKMKTALVYLLFGAAALGFSGAAAAANSDNAAKQTYKAAKDKADGDYKAAKEKCGALKGNEKDVCNAEAKAARDKAKAQAEAEYKGTPKAEADARKKEADADYDVAMAICVAIKCFV
jgi:hypothetical protein